MSSIQSLVNQAIGIIAQSKIAEGLKQQAKATGEEVLYRREEGVSAAKKEVETTQESLSRSKAPGKVKELTKKLESQQKAYEEAEASLEAAKSRLRGDYGLGVIGGKAGIKVVL